MLDVLYTPAIATAHLHSQSPVCCIRRGLEHAPPFTKSSFASDVGLNTAQLNAPMGSRRLFMTSSLFSAAPCQSI